MAAALMPERLRPKMALGEIVSFAYDTFCSNKVRFILTALGMVIGTASLILVVTIGMTGRQYVLSQIQAIGANLIYAQYQGAPHISQSSADNLTIDDVEAVRSEVPGVAAATPVVNLSERVPFGDGKEREADQGDQSRLLHGVEQDERHRRGRTDHRDELEETDHDGEKGCPRNVEDEPEPVRMLAFWAVSNRLAGEASDDKLGDRYLVLRFEDLCLQPETTAQRLIGFRHSTPAVTESNSIRFPCRFGRHPKHAAGRHGLHGVARKVPEHLADLGVSGCGRAGRHGCVLPILGRSGPSARRGCQRADHGRSSPSRHRSPTRPALPRPPSTPGVLFVLLPLAALVAFLVYVGLRMRAVWRRRTRA